MLAKSPPPYIIFIFFLYKMTDPKTIKKYELMYKIRQYDGIHLKYMPNMTRFELVDILETLQRYINDEKQDYKGCKTELAKRYLI